MLKELNIALFADADNCGLEYSHFDNTLFQLNEMGNVVYGKIYGVSDRKHKEIINDINKFGFDMAPVMRVKKRGSKVFDNRILIDVMDEVLSNGNIDAVCIVAARADMVPLYSRLHKLGVKIVALDNVDDESLAFVDEVLDIGLVDVIKLPKPATHAAAPETNEKRRRRLPTCKTKTCKTKLKQMPLPQRLKTTACPKHRAHSRWFRQSPTRMRKFLNKSRRSRRSKRPFPTTTSSFSTKSRSFLKNLIRKAIEQQSSAVLKGPLFVCSAS